MPSGSPLDIRAEAKSSTEIVVTWEPPPRDTWNGNLLGYHVGYQILSPETQHLQYTFKSVEVRAHFGGEATLQSLAKYTPYNIIVQVSIDTFNIFYNVIESHLIYYNYIFNLSEKFYIIVIENGKMNNKILKEI